MEPSDDVIELPLRWNLYIVFLSYLVGFVGSYTTTYTLYKIERAEERYCRIIWLMVSCLTFGGACIFSLHFCGMLAVDIGVPISYDPWITFASLVLAVSGTIPAFVTKYRNLFQVVTAPDVESAEDIPLLDQSRGEGHQESDSLISSLKPERHIVLGGFFLAIGILLMHNCGMWSMRIPNSKMHLNALWVMVSFIPAWLFSTYALNVLPKVLDLRQQLTFAVTSTLGVFSLHYISVIWAATFIMDSQYYPPPERPPQESAMPFLIVVSVCISCFGAFIIAAQGISRQRDELVEAIRNRKYIDALKSEKEHLERENREKTEFIAIASHEMRTPLHAIAGFTELLASTDLRPEQEENLQLARQSIRSLESVVDNVLNFTKLINHTMTVEPKWCDLSKVIFDVMTNLSVTVKSPIVILFVNDNDNLTREWCDESLFTQILQNLVSNAYKFTNAGALLVKYRIQNDQAEVLVRDTGIGMSEQQIQTVFQPFSQADKSLSRSHTGSGMGLAVTQHIVELMEGEITVNSALGEGSAFLLRIPIKYQTVGAFYETKLSGSFEQLTPDDIASRTITQYLQKIGMTLDGSQEPHVRWERRLEGYTLHIAYDGESSTISLKRPTNLYDVYVGLKRLVEENVLTLEGVNLHSKRPSQKSVNELHRKKILVAEDNEVNQILIRKQLTKLGYEADFAGNGKEAVEMMGRDGNRYCCILMDIQMPVMDGYESAKIIRKSSDIPIVALTANVSEISRSESTEAGMTDFLGKPVKIDQLKETLGGIMECK